MLVIEHTMPDGEKVHLVGWNKSSVVEYVDSYGILGYRLISSVNIKYTNRLYDLFDEFTKQTRTDRKTANYLIKHRRKENRFFFVCYGDSGKIRKFKFINKAIKFANAVGKDFRGLWVHSVGRCSVDLYNSDNRGVSNSYVGVSQKTLRKFINVVEGTMV